MKANLNSSDAYEYYLYGSLAKILILLVDAPTWGGVSLR
jgi:hypothetical protein